MKSQKFAFDVSWVFISQMITLITSLLFYIILGKYLGPGDLGLYTLSLTIYSIFGIFSGVGIPQAIVKYVAEVKSDYKNLNSLVYSSIFTTLIFGILIGIVLFISSPLIAELYKTPALKELIQIIAVALPFLVVNSTLLGILNGLRKMKSYTLRSVFKSVLLVLFTILFLLLGLGIKGVIMSLLVSEIGTFVLLTLVSLHYFEFSIKMFSENSKKIIKFGSYILLGTVLWTLITNIDKLLVGYFLNDVDLGIYGISIIAANLLLIIPGSISTVTYPVMSSFNSQKQRQMIENLIHRSMRYSIVILSFIGLIMVCLSRPLILLLLNSQFLPVIMPLAILIIGNIFAGAANSVGTSWTAMGRPDLVYKLNFTILLVDIGLYASLIPILGLNGAAIGTASSLILMTLLTFPIYKRIFKINIEVNKQIFSLITIGILIASFFILENYLNIYLLTAVLVTFYFIIVFKFILNHEDIFYIKSILKKRKLSLFEV